MSSKIPDHIRKTIKLDGDQWITEVALSNWQHAGEPAEVASIIRISSGSAMIGCDITPTQARELATMLMRHAEEVEERERLIAELQEVEA